MHGLDAFYKIAILDIFIFVHFIRILVGNTKFKNYFSANQNYGLGAKERAEYHGFDEGIVLHSQYSILDRGKVRKNVFFGINISSLQF